MDQLKPTVESFCATKLEKKLGNKDVDFAFLNRTIITKDKQKRLKNFPKSLSLLSGCLVWDVLPKMQSHSLGALG